MTAAEGSRGHDSDGPTPWQYNRPEGCEDDDLLRSLFALHGGVNMRAGSTTRASKTACSTKTVTRRAGSAKARIIGTAEDASSRARCEKCNGLDIVVAGA